MSAVINTNLASLFAQNSLDNAQSNLATSVQRLSSGLRINSAKDDASGLSISQTMSGHIASLNQASLNAQQATNLAQTEDTSLSTAQDILLRMQQLSVEGSNGSLSNSQRGAIVTELSNLNSQINAFANGTTYNGIQLLGGQNATVSATGLVGGTTGDVASITTATIDVSVVTLASTAAAGTYTLSQTALGTTGSVLTAGNGFISQSVTLSTIAAGNIHTETVNFNNLGISFTVDATASVAVTAATLASCLAASVITVSGGAATSLSFQIGASPTASGDTIALQSYNISTLNGTVTDLNTVGALITDTLSTLASNTGATAASWTSAFQSLQAATSASITDVSSLRASVGSSINQLAYINNNIVAQSANEQAARSTILDTNYSAETSNLTKGQILQQAATAMLAQANQMPNVILSLLK
jgi:flagellin